MVSNVDAAKRALVTLELKRIQCVYFIAAYCCEVSRSIWVVFYYQSCKFPQRHLKDNVPMQGPNFLFLRFGAQAAQSNSWELCPAWEHHEKYAAYKKRGAALSLIDHEKVFRAQTPPNSWDSLVRVAQNRKKRRIAVPKVHRILAS